MFRRTVSALNQQRNGCRGQRFSAISRTLGLNAAAIAQIRKRITRPLRLMPVITGA